MKNKNVMDVVRWRLCVGCGVCVCVCPEKAISLLDINSDGIRPQINKDACKSCGACLNVCPGLRVSCTRFEKPLKQIRELERDWGTVLEVWEGYARDPEFRLRGSSGGAASALALCCIEQMGFGNVLHVGTNRNEPWRNKTIISHSRDDLLFATGSRYSPASPCEALGNVETSNKMSVFIGKPCDIQGLRQLQTVNERIAHKVTAAIGIFCAGTPSTQGTLDLLNRMKINKESVKEIRYRGNGWPGKWEAQLEEPGLLAPSLSYREAWGFLQKYRPYRCHLCPDGTNELSDISCGDPWYRDIKMGEPGYSLVVVRTKTGKDIVQRSIDTGYLVLQRSTPEILLKSQRNLLEKKKAVWGRVSTMKFFGIPSPKFSGFHLFGNWCNLSLREKIRSSLGTVRRIIQRKYYKPIN